MALFQGVRAGDEIASRYIIRNSYPLSIRILRGLGNPNIFAMAEGGVAAVGIAFPVLVPVLIPVSGILWLFFRANRPALPLRVPKHLRAKDPTELHPATKKPEIGEGIVYLGNDRDPDSAGQECWITNSDARTHMLVLGTTGSGKTEFLLSLCFNAIAWGSGFIYVDGKADNSLPYKVYSMCKRVGREEDFFCINFLTGNEEAFIRGRDDARKSNTINVFADGSSDTWTQMVSSLMAEAGGDNALWKGLAVGMINGVLRGLSYKKVRYGLPVDAGVIRDHIELGKLMDLTREFAADPDVNKDLVLKPLESYLVNLPGFDWQKNMEEGEPVGEDTKKQHDFRSMQFMRQLAMLADTYGSIFRHRLPEVDMLDTAVNRRILVVMIPSLEKSDEESEGLGKLMISALKLMMSLTLGSHVEGMYEDVVESKMTNAPSPYPVVQDEIGYYFTLGEAVMFAQARSLGFWMVAGGQDIPAIMKGKNANEASSMIANTKYKISLAMEDPEKTADLIIKTAGEGLVAEASGFAGQSGLAISYQDMMNASIQKRARVTLQELRDLDSGEGILMWRDRVVRFSTFYLFGSARITTEVPLRINRLLKLYAPTPNDLERFIDPISKKGAERVARMNTIFCSGQSLHYGAEPVVLVDALKAVVGGIGGAPSASELAPKDRIAVLFSGTRRVYANAIARGGNVAATTGGGGSTGGGVGVKPQDTEAQEPPASVTPPIPEEAHPDPVAEVFSPALAPEDSVDVGKYLDQESFVVESKAVAQELTVDTPSLDWVDAAVAVAGEPSEAAPSPETEVVMEKNTAELLALMDSSLLGGKEVPVPEAAARGAQEILKSLEYEAPPSPPPPAPAPEEVPTTTNEVPTGQVSLEAQVKNLRDMFDNF